MLSPQRFFLTFGLVVGGLMAAPVSAELIAHDTFDYSGNSLAGQGAADDGWAGAWTLTQNGPDNFHRLAPGSLSFPAGVDLAPAGRRISNMSDEVATRDLAQGISTNPASPREVWVSFLVNKSDTGNVEFGFERSRDGIRRMVWGFGADERMRVNVGDSVPFFATTDAFPVDTDLLVVVKMTMTNQASPTSDTIALKVFKPGDKIEQPIAEADFDITRSGTTGVVLDRFFIDGNSQVQQIDELRIGDRFEDVVPIPEPTVGSLGLGAGLLVLLRRP